MTREIMLEKRDNWILSHPEKYSSEEIELARTRKEERKKLLDAGAQMGV